MLTIEAAIGAIADVAESAVGEVAERPTTAALAAVARDLRAATLDEAGAVQSLRAPLSDVGADIVRSRVRWALDVIGDRAPWRPDRLPSPRATTAEGGVAEPELAYSDRDPRASSLARPLRLAIEAAISGTIAIIIGHMISEERWYWAVIASYVVYVRSTTMGETASRAWERVAGTVIGVTAGLVIAALVGSYPEASLAVLFVGVFGAYYCSRSSYTIMIACITVDLALLYVLLGRYDPTLMYMRFIETLAGATIGVVVAMLVLPSRSSAKLELVLADVLRGAASAVAVALSGTSDSADASLVAEVRRMDHALQELRNAVRPLEGWSFPIVRSDAAEVMTESVQLAYAVRQLAVCAVHPARAAAMPRLSTPMSSPRRRRHVVAQSRRWWIEPL